MSSEVVLSIKGVSKRYEIYDKPSKRLWQMICMGKHDFFREFWALRDISFDIRRGESWAIIGRNGAGKSTLLKIITGTLRQTRGRVVRKGKIAALLELGNGFNPEFTGRENVFLNASILGLTREETEARYREIVEFADIGDFIDQPVKKYSSGMRLRLAFAVQVVVRPDVLIVDEALAVGDMFFQQKCMARMRKLREGGTTLLFVSHSLPTVKSLCDKAVYLKNGRVVAIGASGEVCEKYQLEGAAPVRGGEAKVPPPVAPAARPGVPTTPIGLARYREDPLIDKHCVERRGSGELKVMAADFYDTNGVRLQMAESAQVVCLAVSLRAVRDVPAGASVAISCRDKLSNVMTGVHLEAYGKSLPALWAGERVVVEFTFRIPFIGGQYFWLVKTGPAGYTNETCYDLCMGLTALPVSVAKGALYEYSYGKFLLGVTDIAISREEA